MDICIICLDNKNLILYNECCKVIVHKECIDEWNKISNYKCIICKKEDNDYYNHTIDFDINIEYKLDKIIIVTITLFILILNCFSLKNFQ